MTSHRYEGAVESGMTFSPVLSSWDRHGWQSSYVVTVKQVHYYYYGAPCGVSVRLDDTATGVCIWADNTLSYDWVCDHFVPCELEAFL